jgi:hypothetical protein
MLTLPVFAVRRYCGEMRANVNPRNNLAHCFTCKKNLTNIDLLMMLDYRDAVAVLERMLNEHQARLAKPVRSTP